jgi:hypothetical protein
MGKYVAVILDGANWLLLAVATGAVALAAMAKESSEKLKNAG